MPGKEANGDKSGFLKLLDASPTMRMHRGFAFTLRRNPMPPP
jgi:hypothetical protein